ncbi:hypothetical protein O3M35_004589 [Rhynocoris fuscipes]|uniref:Uncharacterized protein n=1 Tax=Rhynocoris fuscipes TaxID=488301 RepID=A0AAW1CG05_9HEMI
MGKDQELLEAARNGNLAVVEKILGQRAKRSGPLARHCERMLFTTALTACHRNFPETKKKKKFFKNLKKNTCALL